MSRSQIATFVLAAVVLAGSLASVAAAAPKPDCAINFFQVQTPSNPATVQPGGAQAYTTAIGQTGCVDLVYTWRVDQPGGAMTQGGSGSTFTAGTDLGAFWVTVEVVGKGGTGAAKDTKQKVNVRGATSLGLAPATATEGGSAQLAATLTYAGSGIAGQSITFTVVGAGAGTATTDANGIASLSFPLGTLAPGTYAMSAAFAGSDQYIGSSAAGMLTVLAAPIVPPVAPADTTPPSTPVPQVAGPLGSNGWYVGDVQITATATDPQSGVTSVACDPSAIMSDTVSTTVTCAATNGAGLTSSVTLTIMRDATAPTIASSASPAANANGWNNTDVTITYVCVDATSGIATCPAPQTFSLEGANQSASGSAQDNAGNTAISATTLISIDKTAPVITFAGAQEYTVDQTVAITCTASDALSGVASATCLGTSGPAYLLVGANTLSATATDRAGNVANEEYGFTVRVTAASLCSLTKSFASKPLGNSLCAQLSAAAAAGARGNLKAKANALEAYTREVRAQTGKAFAADKAAILAGLVAHLSN